MSSALRHPLSLAIWAAAFFALAACGGSVDSPDSDDAGAVGGGAGAAGTAGAPGAGGSGNADGCSHNGTWHPAGSSWPSDCNTCTCHSGGQISCTAAMCFDCLWNGQGHMIGESWPSNDGCNTCSCAAKGSIACTEMACAVCVYAGKTYKPGDTFPSLDGCNKCECTSAGVASCTLMYCGCDPDKEWWRNYVAKSPSDCAAIDHICPANTNAFSNGCGCGCEQDASCPEYINCMPPAPNCESDKQRCPFSKVAL